MGLDELGRKMTAPKSLTPEMLVPRLGDYLVEKGLIAQDDLMAALQYQRKRLQQGEGAQLIGQILIDMGFISRTSLDAAVTEQILQLRAALEENNRELENRVRQRTSELQQALDKLSELNQLKANFVANISHELRTPMTHIKGYLELLSSGDLGLPSGEQQRALKTMSKATERLEKLIEDLILFSTSEHNNINLRVHHFNLAMLCEEIAHHNEANAREHKVEISLQAAPNLPMVYADMEKISWVIQQLVDNAIKFIQGPGEVRIELSTADHQVRCTIMDNGIGIPQDRLQEIFEPFHQLDSSSTRRYGGTGLGLSLAKKIIEAHGSSIEVQSAPGEGSTFSFLLPARNETSGEQLAE
jgi:signal transduction histidine kinase